MRGGRSIAHNIKTLTVQPHGSLAHYDVILLIDDIVTSGNSFQAVNKLLRNDGYTGTIINFAFCRTFPADAAAIALEQKRRKMRKIPPRHNLVKGPKVDGLILDLDQTLIDDTLRNEAYEGALKKALIRTAEASPYKLCSGVESILNLGLPSAILSNRPIDEVRCIFEESIKPASAYQDYLHITGSDIELIPLPEESTSGYTTKNYKPSPKGATEAARALGAYRQYNKAHLSKRILGIGNTKDDIRAYNSAGIESVLALWGVPEYLKEHAANNWGAIYICETPEKLVEIIQLQAEENKQLLRAKKEKKLESIYQRACELSSRASASGTLDDHRRAADAFEKLGSYKDSKAFYTRHKAIIEKWQSKNLIADKASALAVAFACLSFIAFLVIWAPTTVRDFNLRGAIVLTGLWLFFGGWIPILAIISSIKWIANSDYDGMPEEVILANCFYASLAVLINIFIIFGSNWGFLPLLFASIGMLMSSLSFFSPKGSKSKVLTKLIVTVFAWLAIAAAIGTFAISLP